MGAYICLCVSRIFGDIGVAYDYGCDGGVLFGGHSCLVESFGDGFVVWWVGYSNTHPFRGFASLNELKIYVTLCGKLYCAMLCWACEQ